MTDNNNNNNDFDKNIIDVIIDSQRGRQLLMVSAILCLLFIAWMSDTAFGALLFGWIAVLCFIAFLVTQFTELDILRVWQELNGKQQPEKTNNKKKKAKRA